MVAIYGASDDGQKPLVNVQQVKNGWIVTVHQANRDKEISPETEIKRKLEKEKREKERLENEKTRIKKELMTQMASIAIIGEVAGQAQARGIDRQTDAWKFNDDEDGDEDDKPLILAPDKVIKKMDKVIEEMAAANSAANSSSQSLAGYFGCDYPVTETYIFSDRQEMIKFVSEALEPIIE